MREAHRRDEASAHIAGWNAMLGYEKQRNHDPNAGLQAMWQNANHSRVVDFLEAGPDGQARPRAGLAFNADGTLPPTAANIEAMGRYYFDQPPIGTPGVPLQDTVNLGPHGRSDYSNLYGAGLVNHAIFFERTVGVPAHGAASRMALDMGRLRLDEKLLEENGLSIPAMPGQPATQAYCDIGTHPPTTGRFNHTVDGPHAHQHVPVDAVPRPHSARAEPPAEADPLCRQVRTAVERLDASMNRTFDASSEAMTASLYALAREAGLSRVNHVVLSTETDRLRRAENVFVVQGGLMEAGNRVAHMKTAEAVMAPVEQSLQRAQAHGAAEPTAPAHAEAHRHAPALVHSRQ